MNRSGDHLDHLGSLEHALNGLIVDELKGLFNLLPTALLPRTKPTRKAEIVAAVERCLTGNALREVWGRLDKTQQLAVSEALHSADGRFRARQFQAKHGLVPKGLWADSAQRSKPSLLKLFLYLDDYGRSGTAVLPDDLRERLLPFVPVPAAAELAALDDLPQTVDRPRRGYVAEGVPRPIDRVPLVRRDLERAAQQDLRAVLRLIDQGGVTVSPKTRQATAASVRRVAAVLFEGDFFDPNPQKQHAWEQTVGPVRAFAWPLLAQAANLAEPHGNKLALTKAGRTALRKPAAEILRRIWRRWRVSTGIDEFRRIEAIKGQRGRGGRAMTAAKQRRAAIEEALAECPVDRWVRFDDLSGFMQAADLEFEVTRDPWRLYLEEAEYGSLGYDGNHDWSILQGRYLLCFLFEYAATLGMVDVAFIDPDGARLDYTHMWGADDLRFLSRYDGLQYVRLTRLGAYCLGIAETYEPGAPAVRASLSVFPDLRLQVTGGRLTADETLLLETYATLDTDDVWRLDPDKTLAAIESGHPAKELREFLSSRDDQPLPEKVEGFLRSTERRARALALRGTALLIECADADLADLLAGNERTAALCQRAGERGLVVPSDFEDAFRKAIRELGYGMPNA